MEWSPLVKIDVNEATVEEFNTQLKNAIYSAANDAQMSPNERSCTFNHSFKPWFDKSCRVLNHSLKVLLKKWKAAGNDVYLWSEYNRKKKKYYTYLKGKKMHHITTIQDKFACAKNSKDFREVVKTVRKPPYQASKVSLQEWENLFQEVYPPRELYIVVSDVHQHPILDAEITLEELQLSLKKSKCKKAAGADISNNVGGKSNEGNSGDSNSGAARPNWANYSLDDKLNLLLDMSFKNSTSIQNVANNLDKHSREIQSLVAKMELNNKKIKTLSNNLDNVNKSFNDITKIQATMQKDINEINSELQNSTKCDENFMSSWPKYKSLQIDSWAGVTNPIIRWLISI
ncbi:hypothetical protein KQX54_020273 [Cotesia glomerata]|uniref:Uncharacterized protein n=1 Tax=Cotesia glomerata TaxID=32391 RepID=A0AAV7INY4_COTGL|nr:hypothetical protein KQX54_020273 [Cotesia glomerata]